MIIFYEGNSYRIIIQMYAFLTVILNVILYAGDEKEHLKVTLLRIESSLQGLFSCLPDFVPASKNGIVEDSNHTFLIAGATGCTVGTTALREKATEIVHAACK